MSIISKYQEERRGMFKYLATIAGGATALIPQAMEHIIQTNLLYLGAGFLTLVVIISTIYIISNIENDIETLSKDLTKKNNMFHSIRKHKVDFLGSDNKSFENFSSALSAANEYIPEIEKEILPKKETWYRPMDYTSEYIILFFILGLGFLILSLTNFVIPTFWLICISFLLFCLINLMSAFPKKLFTFLGFPIDVIKSIFR